MSYAKMWSGAVLVFGALAVAPRAPGQEPGQSEREAMYYRYLEFASYVKGGSIEPHWMADGSSFWYAEGAPASTVIWNVDPKTDTKTPLFDTARLRQALTPVLGHEPPYQGLPFDKFTFVDKGEKAIKFTVETAEFILQLDSYTVARAPVVSEEERSRLESKADEVPSPDHRWFAGVKDYNLWLRSTYDGRSVQITTDGVKDYEWDVEDAKWSPDSFKLAVEKWDSRKVPKMPIVHWLGPEEEVDWVGQANPGGGPVPQTELFIVDILSKLQVRIDTGEEPDQPIPLLGWRPDGSELLFSRMNRVGKKLDLMAANPTSGATRIILTETQETFISDIMGTLVRPPGFTLLEDGKSFIWMSERDGWYHLYFYDLDGTLLRRLTEGAFEVLRVIEVDEERGWVYFIAHGDPRRPYDTHLYRVNLEGKGFTQLTEAPGQHALAVYRRERARRFPEGVQFSLSKEFFLVTHSSINRPPAVELRRADGTLLQTLSKANIDGLKDVGFSRF